MRYLFSGKRAFTQDISHWDMSSVTSMLGMFEGTISFAGDLSNWDVRNITHMDEYI